MKTTALPLLAASSLQQRLIVAVSLVQGILLYLLYKAVDSGRWPSGHPIPLYLLGTLLVGVPLFFNLLLDKGQLRKALQCLLPFAAIAAGVALYRGWQILPVEHGEDYELVPAYILSMLIAGFLMTIHAQLWVRGEHYSYPALLHTSWRLFLHAAFSGLFTLLLHLVLLLWGGLFDLIGIGIFRFVFQQSWFVIPITTLGFGFALILFNNLDHIIDTVTRLLVTMLRFLLPLLAFVCLLFVAFLPFTGLQGLWEARVGSIILLWLMALMLFFTNAVFPQTAEGQSTATAQPYSLGLYRLIAAAIATLPLFGILVLHGLFTRIAQHGLTVSRIWGLMVALLLLGYAIGYLWSVVRLRDHWLRGLQRINCVMALVVLGLIIASNSPLLNLQRWSAHSQLARLEQGLAPQELDIDYFRRALGRSGHEALMQLKDSLASSNALLATRIDRLYQVGGSEAFTAESLTAMLTTWPTGRSLPIQVSNEVLNSLQLTLSRANGIRWVYALFSDLNADGSEEIVIIYDYGTWYQTDSFYTLREGHWQKHPAMFRIPLTPPALDTVLQQDKVQVVPAPWQQLKLGESVIVPQD